MQELGFSGRGGNSPFLEWLEKGKMIDPSCFFMPDKGLHLLGYHPQS